MIKDIISFSIKDIYLAVDLQTAPIILSASAYTKPNSISLHPPSIEYEGKEVLIINENTSLDLRINKISDTTKILVGEIGDKLFGLFVDEVLGIINVAKKIDKNLLVNTGDRIIIGEIIISDGKFNVIDLQLLAKKYMMRNNFTMISNKLNSKVFSKD